MAVWTPFGTDWQQGTMVAGKPVSTTGYATYVRDNMQYLKDALAGGAAIVTFAAPSVAFATLASPVAGTASTVVRSDHTHQTPATWPIEFRQATVSKGFRAILNIVGGAIVEDDAANARINITPVDVLFTYGITTAASLVTDTGFSGGGEPTSRGWITCTSGKGGSPPSPRWFPEERGAREPRRATGLPAPTTATRCPRAGRLPCM